MLAGDLHYNLFVQGDIHKISHKPFAIIWVWALYQPQK